MRRTVVKTGLFVCAINLLIGTQTVHALSITSIFASEPAGVVASQEPVTNQVPAPAIAIAEPQTNLPKPKKEAEPIKHKVRKGETLSSIAKQHKTSWKRIYAKNKKIENPDAINPNDELVIPTPDEKLKMREVEVAVDEPEAVSAPRTAARRSYAPARQSRGSSAGNRYIRGYCTWYVKNRRPDMPNNLGNAITWVSRAAAQGMATGSKPRAGAVGQAGNHVVYVEKVNSNGTVTVSEMNREGWNVISSRTVAASTFRYIY